MQFLLDANVLIDANRDYYAMDRVPEFWEWLAHHGEQDNVKVPLEIYEEVKSGTDALADWLKDNDIEQCLLLEEAADPAIVSDVVEKGYAPDLGDDEIIKIGRDPFLIAYATIGERCVVTTEASRPSAQRANRQIPDVCNDLGLNWCNAFEFGRRLSFSTSWRDS